MIENFRAATYLARGSYITVAVMPQAQKRATCPRVAGCSACVRISDDELPITEPGSLEALSVSLLNEFKTDRGDSPFHRNCGPAF
jgi:hypothetical protein